MVHQSFPIKIAEDGNNGIQRIQHGCGIEAALYVQCAAGYVCHAPHPPVLYVLSGKEPHAHYAQSGGEGVEHGGSAVGVGSQTPEDSGLRGGIHGEGREPAFEREVGDCFCVLAGSCGFAAILPLPDAVNGYQEIVDVYPKVGIYAGVVVDVQIDGGHDDGDRPKVDAGSIL